MAHLQKNWISDGENSEACSPHNVPNDDDGLDADHHESPPGIRLNKVDTPSRRFGMVGWKRLPENKYEPLMRALVERGPVAVSAAARYWALYKLGIFDRCPKAAVIDHAVVLIAYGSATETNVTTKF